MLRKFQVAYFGASTDKPATNRAFAAKLKLDYPLLSDPGAVVARQYGVAGMLGYASRWTFIIGMDGRILAVVKDVKVETAGADLARKLEELKVPLKGEP